MDKPAFCETFDQPHPGGNGGEIDETRWAFARHNGPFNRKESTSYYRIEGQTGQFDTYSNPDGPPTMCGKEFSGVWPPDDVKVCNGQLNEVHDGSGLAINSFMARQPFDFTNRTGTIVFDVDAKRNDGWDGHGWWLEVWITEDPAPIPYHGAPFVESYPRNGFGFQIAPMDAFDDVRINQLGRFVTTKDFRIVRDDVFDEYNNASSFRVKDTVMNRFKVLISQDSIEVFSTDYDKPDELVWRARSKGLNLPFTVGYVHFQHVHYNAAKTPNCDCEGQGPSGCNGRCAMYPQGFHASQTQAYRWDNIGFDGPVYPMTQGHDLPMNTDTPTIDGEKQVVYGYRINEGGNPEPKTLQVTNIDPTNAKRASLNISFTGYPGDTIRYRLNGKAQREWKVPDDRGWDPIAVLRAFSLDVPVADLVPGTNTVELSNVVDTGYVGNMDISVQ
jgi:hypothetical protein